MKKWVYIILLCLFSGLAVFSGFKIIQALTGYHKAEKVYESAWEECVSVVETTEAPTTTKAETPAEETETDAVVYPDYSAHEHLTELSLLNVAFNYILMPEYVLDFESLQAQNPEVTAWIRIEDTKIDYPVVQGEDNSKYLRVGADGQALNAGAIFIDYRNDPFNDKVTIIYGHNQRNHAIFHDLLGYREQSYLESHPYVEIYLPDGSSVKYQVFAAGLIDAVGSNYRFYFSSDEEYLEYLETCVSRAEASLDVDFSSEDQIIMLSTCTNDYDDSRRMAVYARRIGTD